MPKGKALSPEQREKFYSMYLSGMRQGEIAELFGIHSVTVSKVVNDQRKMREERSMSEIVVAGDKRNGRLVSHGKDRFEGTCLIAGKMKRRTFSAPNAQRASVEWEKWCQTLRDEQDFMDMVERKREPLEESEAVCGYPSDPIEEIHPVQDVKIPSDETIREAIYEAQEEFDAVTTKHMEATGVPLADTSEPAYLIWAKKPEPRCYGLYLTMESALSEVDKLNEVAAFLGGDGAFEVEEVTWKC